jgi:GNAT superfamily N-acetyltransferase
MNIQLRRAEPEEAEVLSILVNSAYRGEASKQGWTTEASLLDGQRTDPDSLRSLITKRDSVILVVTEPKLLGCVYLERRETSAYLGMLTVKPDLQSSGLGKKILALAEDWAQTNWHAKRIAMTVIQKRLELIAWYERRGYSLTGEKQPFPYGDEKFGIPKTKDLYFIVLAKKL